MRSLLNLFFEHCLVISTGMDVLKLFRRDNCFIYLCLIIMSRFIPKFCSTMLRVHSQGNVTRGNSYDVPAQTPACVTALIIPIIRPVIGVCMFKQQ